MISEHCFQHRQIALTHQGLHFHEDTEEHIEKFLARAEPITPPLDIFLFQPRTTSQTAAVEIHLDQLMMWFVKTEIIPLERLLCEIILLHRMAVTLEPLFNRQTQARRAYVLMGAMMQERLVRLIVKTHPASHDWLYGLGSSPTLDKMFWETNYRGAASVARFIHAVHEAEGITMRLPTIEDDLDYGIDLYLDVLPHGDESTHATYHLAVSIKSSVRSSGFFINHLTTASPAYLRDIHKRILSGVQKVTALYELTFHPLGVMIGQTEHDPNSLEGRAEDALIIERFLSQFEARRSHLNRL